MRPDRIQLTLPMRIALEQAKEIVDPWVKNMHYVLDPHFKKFPLNTKEIFGPLSNLVLEGKDSVVWVDLDMTNMPLALVTTDEGCCFILSLKGWTENHYRAAETVLRNLNYALIKPA